MQILGAAIFALVVLMGIVALAAEETTDKLRLEDAQRRTAILAGEG